MQDVEVKRGRIGGNAVLLEEKKVRENGATIAFPHAVTTW